MKRWVVLVLFLTASLAPAADWPQWLGAKRDNGTSEKVAPWKEAPKVLWKQKAGVGFASPVVADGRVYVHARVAGKEAEELIAFDADSGKELWRTAYEREPYASVVSTGPQATPTVANKKVYTCGITGVLTCFDAVSGKQLWQVDTTAKFRNNRPRFGVCCSPIVVGDLVLMAVGGKGSCIVAFDAGTGEVRWQGFDEPANTSSPVLFRAQGQAVPDVVFATSLRLMGINPLDGTVRWEYPLAFQPAGTSPTPLVVGDLVIPSSQKLGTRAVKVTPGEDKSTAKLAWHEKEKAAYFSTGVGLSKDRVVVVTNTVNPIPQADLTCLDTTSGKVLWEKTKVGYFHAGVIRLGDGKLLVLDDAGNLVLLQPTEKECNELSRAKVCDGTLVAPALANGKLYVRDGVGITCLELNP